MKQKLRILVATDLRKISHSVRPEFQMFVHWAASGHEVTVFTPPSGDKEQIESAGITLVESQQKRKISWRTIQKLRGLLKQASFDIIYATNSKTIPSAAFASIGLKTKLVAYRGTTSGMYRTDPTSYLTILHPRVDAIACVSESVRRSVLRKTWLDESKVVAIHKGQDLAWYDQSPANLVEKGIPEGAFVIVAVANFRPKKGLSVLLEAAGQVADLEDTHFLVVGPGTDKEPYRSAIQNSPARDRIHCTGFHGAAPTLIAASDVLVQASVRGEGLPRTVVESLAYGVPVISTDVGGAQEIVDEGKSGFIVPAGSAGAIAEKIRYLHNHREQLEAMSAECRQVVQNKLSTGKTAAAYLAFFERLTGQR